jgi:hypothetical protein
LYALPCKAVLLVISTGMYLLDMQVLLQTRPVQEEETKAALLDVLADKYSRAILESTLEMPKSTIDLSSECGIPISTTYRRVQLLHHHKLLGISGSISQDGKKYFLYKSKIKSIVTRFDNGALDVEIVPSSEQKS